MLRAHPCRGFQQGGKSQARGPAIAKQTQQRPIFARCGISHNVYYVQSNPGVAGTYLASIPSPAVAWSLIVRDRNLTGPWAGFSFKGGRLVTPEGRELEPQDLAWLSLTAAQAQEWRRMMGQLRGDPRSGHPRNRCSTKAARNAFPAVPADVIEVATLMARRQERLSRVMAGPDAEPPAGVLPAPGPRRRQRV
ncbi:DUF3653 domain-containing protein [Stenotrophomonas sp.]|uniref:DUF3653 domain-containing protein n=1 Tax=Stenotrophomonas sp. TaxID=69392 RepID=UPI0028AF2086|nr:DUF3653 domain-containing protein [Stenotrophomonas sp.]